MRAFHEEVLRRSWPTERIEALGPSPLPGLPTRVQQVLEHLLLPALAVFERIT
jgi:hypothetical protein